MVSRLGVWVAVCGETVFTPFIPSACPHFTRYFYFMCIIKITETMTFRLVSKHEPLFHAVRFTILSIRIWALDWTFTSP